MASNSNNLMTKEQIEAQKKMSAALLPAIITAHGKPPVQDNDALKTHYEGAINEAISVAGLFIRKLSDLKPQEKEVE